MNRQRFAEMPIGTRFSDSGDEWYDEFYKVSATEAVNTTRYGLREPIQADAEFILTGQPVQLHDSPTDVERVALTLLDQHSVTHIGLSAWKLAVLGDMNETRELDQFLSQCAVQATDGTPILDAMRGEGYVLPTPEDRLAVWTSILDRKPTGAWPTDDDGRCAADMDRAALSLATAVVHYRAMGRPDGTPYSGAIQGMGGPLLTVTTDLAAAVVEYHRDVANAICVDYRRKTHA